jgi:class 3 adenylate cyclase
VPIHDRIFVGRECSGIRERNRLLIDGPDVSRNHLEIRVEPENGFAYVIDTSTNGTRLNGSRIERAVPVPLTSGDRLTIGAVQLAFRIELASPAPLSAPIGTVRGITLGDYAMVVGDIVGFSTMAQESSSRLVLESLDTLLREMRRALAQHHGTLSNFVGDAFFAVWELDSVDNAAELAVRFAVAAADRVNEVAPALALHPVDGGHLRMGWGVSVGEVAVTSLTGSLLGVVGDAANLAFRLSALAARGGRSEIMVTEAIWRQVADLFPFGELDRVEVKGRRGSEPVRELRVPLVPR